MSLRCQRCDHQGGEDLSFIWFAETFEVVKKDGGKKKRTLWLCPDCSSDLGSTKKCAAFLRRVVAEK